MESSGWNPRDGIREGMEFLNLRRSYGICAGGMRSLNEKMRKSWRKQVSYRPATKGHAVVRVALSLPTYEFSIQMSRCS